MSIGYVVEFTCDYCECTYSGPSQTKVSVRKARDFVWQMGHWKIGGIIKDVCQDDECRLKAEDDGAWIDNSHIHKVKVHMSVEDIITDKEAVDMHGGSDFGYMTPRDVINDGVVKVHLGYGRGSVQNLILLAHGLTTEPQNGLTNKGEEYLAALLKNNELSSFLKTPVKRT